MKFGSKHPSISEAFLAFSRWPVYLSFMLIPSGLKFYFKKVVARFDAIQKLFTLQNDKNVKILKICLRIFLIAINVQCFSNENAFCLQVRVCILKDFQIYAFLNVKLLN